MRKGIYFALATAIISGFSVYINKFAVMQMKDPFVFTTVKNVAVALMLFALLTAPRALPELKRLSGRQWLWLGVIGAVGGSVPFLLFFKGLTMANAATAGFIHKTLFIWVALLAVPFLGERLTKVHVAALATLIGGNILLLGLPSSWAMGSGELLVFIATILWAVEAVIARRVMRNVSTSVAAFGRMFFGALVMLGYLGGTGKLTATFALNSQQVFWVAVTAAFLFGYVTCYYAGLKYAPASVVASVLVLGSVITSLLYAIFDAKTYTLEQIIGMLVITAATVAFWHLTPKVRREEPLLAEN
jgi:drug/metabolite transporter (DMT)-like permease